VEVQKQIEILTKAKKNVAKGVNWFVCVSVMMQVNEYKNRNLFAPINMGDFIPLLTFKNAQMVCRKYKLKVPVLQDDNSWWKRSEIKPRLAFFNWMIKELKKEL